LSNSFEVNNKVYLKGWIPMDND